MRLALVVTGRDLMETTAIYFEPWDPACQSNLFETYAQLLEQAPVYRAPNSGIWVVSSYEAVSDMMLRADTFSNRPNQDETIGFPPKIDPDSEEYQGMMGRLLEAAVDIPLDFQEIFTARVIVGADPPVHTRQRRLVGRGFTPRRIAELKPMIERTVADKLAAVRGRPHFDLVKEVAAPIPTAVIASLLSVEPERYGDIRHWSDQFSNLSMSADRGSMANIESLLAMLRDFSQYFVPKIEDRRAHPQDDLLSDIVQADGVDLLSATELVLFMMVLLSAGNETTANVIGNTVLQLVQRPDQIELLENDPSLIPAAIEESIRLYSPFQFLFREPVVDVEVGGVTIPAGDMIAILIGAANRDPKVFDRPNEFDLTRRTPHLAFGKGIHFCLGAPLARLEADVALRALLPHLRSWSIDTDQLRRQPSLLIYGHESIPVTVSQN
jgi:cytochrome P450